MTDRSLRQRFRQNFVRAPNGPIDSDAALQSAIGLLHNLFEEPLQIAFVNALIKRTIHFQTLEHYLHSSPDASDFLLSEERIGTFRKFDYRINPADQKNVCTIAALGLPADGSKPVKNIFVQPLLLESFSKPEMIKLLMHELVRGTLSKSGVKHQGVQPSSNEIYSETRELVCDLVTDYVMPEYPMPMLLRKQYFYQIIKQARDDNKISHENSVITIRCYDGEGSVPLPEYGDKLEDYQKDNSSNLSFSRRKTFSDKNLEYIRSEFGQYTRTSSQPAPHP